MTKTEYELHLLKNVQWWLYTRKVCNFGSDDAVICYQGNVFGVRILIELKEIEKIALKHGLKTPACLIGG